MSNLIKLKDYSNVSEKNELTQEKLREQLLKLSADNVFSIPEMSDEEKNHFVSLRTLTESCGHKIIQAFFK